jgi:hypothetical protein
MLDHVVSVVLVIFPDCSGLKSLSWGNSTTICIGIASEFIGCMVFHGHGGSLETFFSPHIVEIILSWELRASYIL